jgi:hypothetical protein
MASLIHCDKVQFDAEPGELDVRLNIDEATAIQQNPCQHVSLAALAHSPRLKILILVRRRYRRELDPKRLCRHGFLLAETNSFIRNPLIGTVNVGLVGVEADVVPLSPQGGHGGCAGTYERIEDNVSLVCVQIDQALWKFHWKRGRMANSRGALG